MKRLYFLFSLTTIISSICAMELQQQQPLYVLEKVERSGPQFWEFDRAAKQSAMEKKYPEEIFGGCILNRHAGQVYLTPQFYRFVKKQVTPTNANQLQTTLEVKEILYALGEPGMGRWKNSHCPPQIKYETTTSE